MKMCEQILKKTAPQYNSNSLNCEKESTQILAVERLAAAINKLYENGISFRITTVHTSKARPWKVHQKLKIK